MPAVVFHFERTAGPRNDIIFAFLNISDLWGIEFMYCQSKVIESQKNGVTDMRKG